jgi:hypothetical protein
VFAILRGLTKRSVLAIAVASALASSAPIWPRASAATTVVLENTAPLEDRSTRGIGRAIEQAVHQSIRGASMLGLSWIEVEEAVVLTDRVLVRTVAGDQDADQVQDDRAGDEDVRVLDLGIAGASRADAR